MELAPDARDRLEAHARLLLAWTPHINLTGIREPDGVVREHLLDSLSAVPLLTSLGVERIVDVGSGGGFPGLPLAVAMPGARVLLVESIAKKARFLVVVAAALGLAGRVTVANARAETLHDGRRPGLPADAVCVRAVADLAALARLAAPLLSVGGHLVAWKRGDLTGELAGARTALEEAGFGETQVHPVTVSGLEDHRLVLARLRTHPRRPAGVRSRR